mmetsp:Transcript_30491/g.45101  ORF Transcript_30491/g.45101 Transcript_30491/m.45101 type:complete len:84 (-) Transcript_30491:44-295(-)
MQQEHVPIPSFLATTPGTNGGNFGNNNGTTTTIKKNKSNKRKKNGNKKRKQGVLKSESNTGKQSPMKNSVHRDENGVRKRSRF